jgi:hypothetical protein
MSTYAPPPQTGETTAHRDYINGHDPELGYVGQPGTHNTVSQVYNQQAAAPQHRSTISQVRDPQFFKVANPGPLGLISFAITTLCLGFYQCGVG